MRYVMRRTIQANYWQNAMPLSQPDTSLQLPGGKKFSVQVRQAETSGVLASAFLNGHAMPSVLGLSPTSSTVNLARLHAILAWLLPRSSQVTILEGSWFHRWDDVAFNQRSLTEAEGLAMRAAQSIARRIDRVTRDLDHHEGKARLLPWPATARSPAFQRVSADLEEAIRSSIPLRDAVKQVVEDYLASLRDRSPGHLSSGAYDALLSYVKEEIAAFIYLAREISPIEVYAGPDLPILRRIAAGDFHAVLPYDLSQRSHISLALIELPFGTLREATPLDWPRLEDLLRAWPTHFTETAINLARADFLAHHTIVLADDEDRPVGFMIWKTDGKEIELLWMATDPVCVRQGVARAVVQAVECRRVAERRIFGRSATLDSRIPGTPFRGEAYAGTECFFRSLGYHFGPRHDGYWGPANHMIELEKRYDR